MTPSQAAYRAGCIVCEVEAKLSKDRFSATLMGNLSRMPSGLPAYLRHLWTKVLRDAELVEMLSGFDPPPGPIPEVDQGSFWLGYYHQRIVRDLPEGFPARLKSLRESAGLSVQELAEAASITRQAVHGLEAGEKRPTWDTVQALAAALNVPTDTFRDAS